jgi:WD40 repeat protein
VHRDIKPANILLENGVERVKITDFGLARAAADASLTQSGVFAGTPHYMSPEQAGGDPVDQRTDLFSLGSVLYTMCTGRAPFRASGMMAVLKRVCEDTPRPIRDINPEIPDWLVEIITRLHAKDPAERLQAAAEVAELLSAHLAVLQQNSAVQIRRVPRSPSRRVRRWRVVAATLLLLLGGLALTEATGATRIAATVVRVLTPDGTLVVEVEDPDIKVTVEGHGDLVITGAGTQEVRLRPGSYRLRATKDGKPIQTEVVSIARGDKQVVRVSLEAAGLARPTFTFEPPPRGPLDLLDPVRIPATERFPWQPKELVAVLGEHRGRMWDPPTWAAFSPDGKRVASCGYNGLIYVWDAETLHLRALLVGNSGNVLNWGVAFSPDGRRLLSGGDDETVRLWDLDTGRELRSFRGHTGGVWCVACSADGRYVLSGGEDHTLRLWDIESGTELAPFEGHKGRVTSVAFSSDGVHVLSGSMDKSLRLWNLKTRREVSCFGTHTGTFRIAFLPDGRRALSGSLDRTVRLWDVQTGQELRRFEGHTDAVFNVAVSADGRQAVSIGTGRTLHLWNLETGKETRRLQIPELGTSAVAISRDGRRAVAGSGQGNLRLWDLESGKELNPPMEHRKGPGLRKMAFSPDGRRLLASVGDAFMRLWDVTSGQELHRLEVPNALWGLAFSSDGRQVLGAGGGMALWDAESGWELRRFAGASGLWDAVLSRDGRRIVTGGIDQTVRLWDVESGRELNCFRGHQGDVYSVSLAPDGRTAVSGCGDGSVRLWDLETGRERALLQEHGARIWGVAFSPDGHHIAAGDGDGFVRLWDVSGTDPKLRPLLKWHTGGVHTVAFAPDAQTLVSGGWDGRIILWDVPTGTKRQTWQLPGNVQGAAFAPDSRHLAVANGNGTTYILRLSKP